MTTQTPKQIVTDRIQGAVSRKRGDDGRYEIVDTDFRRIGDTTTTAAAAWKQAADHLALLDLKHKQAEEFNAQAFKAVALNIHTPVDERDTYSNHPAPATISPKEKAQRRAKGKIARASRKKNRQRAS